MIRTRVERCIFFFLLTVVVVRVIMVGEFSAPQHHPQVVHTDLASAAGRNEAGVKVKQVGPAKTTGEAATASIAVRSASESSNDNPEPEPTIEDRIAKREAAAEKASAEEKAALAKDAKAKGAKAAARLQEEKEDDNGPDEVIKKKGTDGKAGGRKAGRKEAGANWNVLDNLRMVEDGTKLVTHKRQFIVFNQTLNHTVLRHWLEYEDDNETLVYHFPRSLFELLPLEEPQWHFKTCAVVGNSGVVLLRENGAEIDAHEAIMRINMAPVRGFEHYVGKKTTFNIVNSHNVRELLQGIRHWTGSPEGDARLVMFETASHFARYHLLQPLLKKFPQAHPILLNPIFSNRAHRVWVQLKYLFEQKENNQYNRKPMSGFFAVFFALNICEKVDLYGFDSYTSKKRSYRYHYFDNVQGFTDVHSFDLAIEVYKLIAEKGLINIVM